MNKKSLAVIFGVLVVVVAGSVYVRSQSNDTPISTTNTPELRTDESTTTKVSNSGETMAKGSYTAYDQAKLTNAEKGDVVIFFHAGWCPKCQESDKNFNASATPDGLTLLKVDYDNSTKLKQKYGVTMQHTYVQVDKDGNEIKQWSGSYTYDDLKSQIN